MTPQKLAGEYVFDCRNRAKDALAAIERAAYSYEIGQYDRAEQEIAQAVDPVGTLAMLLVDARRKLRAAAHPEAT